MALTTTTNGSVLVGSPNAESFGTSQTAPYVYGAGGNDSFNATNAYTALYSGAITDYAFSTGLNDAGSRVLFIQDVRIGSPDGLDQYQGSGSLGFGFNPDISASGQSIDLRTAASLLAMLPSSPNQLPIAFNDSITLPEDTALKFDAIQNDTDPESDPLRVVGVVNAAGNAGSAVLGVDGQITYTAIGKFDSLGAGERADESFTYVVSDGRSGSDEGRVDVQITGVNDAPVARADQISLGQNQSINFNPLSNDSDIDHNDSIQITGVSSQQGNAGVIGIGLDGKTLSYSAAGKFDSIPRGQTTSETFSYTIADEAGATSTAQVNVTISGDNDKPMVVNDTIAVTEDQAISFNPAGNDTDPDQGDKVRVSAISNPATNKGVAQVDGSGNQVTYSAINHFESLPEGGIAQETFSYTAVDNNGGSSPGTVTVNITGVNDAPVAVNDAIQVTEDINLTFTASGNDREVDQGDSIRTVSVSNPAGNKGTAILNAQGDIEYKTNGAFEELPVGAKATESFTYEVADNLNAKDQGRVDVTVVGVNDAPVANIDTAMVSEDQSIVIDPIANDSDVDRGDVLQLASATAVSGSKGQVTTSAGRVIYNAEGRFDSLAPGETASESFSYQVKDNNGGFATSTVAVTIEGKNDNPVANPDSFSVSQGASVNINPVSNDTDVDNGDVLKVSAVNNRPGAKGAVSVDGNGNVSYSAVSGFEYLAKGETSQETFDYTVADKYGGSNRGQATVTITGGNDAPVAADDQIVISEEQLLEAADGILLANDRDVDNRDSLKVSAASDAPGNNSQGALSFESSSGRVIYNPAGKFDNLAEGQSTDVKFNYTVTDKEGASSSAQANVRITGVNDAPVAVNDTLALKQGESTSSFNPAANDTDVDNGDTRRVIGVINPTTNLGQATLNTINNTVSYTAGSAFNYLAAGQTKTETFSYTVEDRYNGSDRGDVSVTITGVNDAPEAVDDVVKVGAGQSLRFDPTSNDRDVDQGDALRVSSVSLGNLARGAISIGSDGKLFYESSGKFDFLPQGSSAVETVNYTISDKLGAQSSGKINVVVDGVNDAPIGQIDSFSLLEDQAIAVEDILLANDTDIDQGDKRSIKDVSGLTGQAPDGTTKSYSDVIKLTNGQVSFNAAGKFDYLNQGENFKGDFSYVAGDLFGASTDRTNVSVTINGINDTPILKDIANLKINEGGSTVSIAIADAASDADQGDILRFDEMANKAAFIEGSNKGRFIVSEGGGSIAFDPGKDFEYLGAGEKTISSYNFSIRDLRNATATGQLNVEVTGVNDAPELKSPGTEIRYRVGEDFTATSLDLVKDGKVFDVDRNDLLSIKQMQSTTAGSGLVMTNTSGSQVLNLGVSNAAGFNFNMGGQNGAATTSYNEYDKLDDGESAFEKIDVVYKDISGATVTAPITLEIQGRNDAPIRIDGVSTNLNALTPDSVGIALTTPTTITQQQLLGTAFYDVDGDPLNVTELKVLEGGGKVTAVAGGWQYMPSQAGDVKLGFTVSDGTATLNANANLTVKDPYLGDAAVNWAMVKDASGGWSVVNPDRSSGSVQMGSVDKIQLTDGRGNNYVNSYLPEGYAAVGFDADWIAPADGQGGGQWQFDLILRGDDPVTGDSVFRLQRFEGTADGKEAASLRNTELLTEVDVIKLETELYNSIDAGSWRQVDINGDGVLGLNLKGTVLATSGKDKVIDGGSGLLLFEGNSSSKETAVLDVNTRLLTNNDGTEAYALEGYKAAAIGALGDMTQVWFVETTNTSKADFLTQVFDNDGHALGVAQVVNTTSFNAATQLGAQLTTAQTNLENSQDQNHTILIPSNDQTNA
ncbi:Ig-like domain-containing protein [Synechococcus sp. UW140]|uniref:Ig-like domain-containing protein n=1 Tax=Synechococcus sp. UW140 TaxID=368503 RepID=UPI003137E5BC